MKGCLNLTESGEYASILIRGACCSSLYQKGLYESLDFGKTWKQAGLEGSAINSFVFLPKTRNYPGIAEIGFGIGSRK